MSHFVLDLFNRSIGGDRALAERQDAAGRVKPHREKKLDLGTPQDRPPAQKESICFSGVFRSYKNSRGSFTPALQNIDLEIEQGEFVCIVGPPGCGKSTLLHLLAGLAHPTTGEITRSEEHTSE